MRRPEFSLRGSDRNVQDKNLAQTRLQPHQSLVKKLIAFKQSIIKLLLIGIIYKLWVLFMYYVLTAYTFLVLLQY